MKKSEHNPAISQLKGGGQKLIPQYKEPKNSPHVPTEQREIITDRYIESQKMLPTHLRKTQDIGEPIDQSISQKYLKPAPGQCNTTGTPGPQPGQTPLVDLQVYAPPRPAPPKKTIDPQLFVPSYTNTPFYPPQYQGGYYPENILYRPNQLPIIKNYTINVSGPTDDHTKVSAIYEDILPSKQFVNTSNTIGERINVYNFVRSVFIKQGDGEDINLDGKGENSLMSYLKFMDLNPYSTSNFTENPYKSLPEDMLIYRSCYPIRYDRYSNSVQCAKNSVGMNIRIYKLTFAEYNIKEQSLTNYYEYNIWREVAYYEYIREQIIKRKICPNFVMMYGYYICQQCNIDFNKLAQIKGKCQTESTEKITNNNTLLPGIMVGGHHLSENIIICKCGQYHRVGEICDNLIKSRVGQSEITIVPNENAFSGRALIAITESPNYNMNGWASRTYQADGNVRKMVNTGFHTSDVWESVLFQMIVAQYVLQVHGIAFRDFTIKDNIYIKDINIHSNVKTYWKYKVNGIDYYIPNNGYLVMIDSNFKDIEKQDYTLGQKSNKDKKYKIYSNIYGQSDGKEWAITGLNKLSFNGFKNTVNPNEFSNSFTNEGGSKPPEDVMDLLSKMYNDATNGRNTNYNIEYYIFTYMRMFMNNRIGTLLKEIEVKNVRKDDQSPFTKGQLVINEVQHDTYKFVMFVQTISNGQAIILTKEKQNDIDIIEKEVSLTSLFNYSKYDPIIQNYKANESNFTEEGLLEVYEINCN